MKRCRKIILASITFLPCLLPGVTIDDNLGEYGNFGHSSTRLLAVDDNGRIHLCYGDHYPPSKIFYWYSDDGTWNTANKFKIYDRTDYDPSLAVNRQTGRPYVLIKNKLCSEDDTVYYPKPEHLSEHWWYGSSSTVAINPKPSMPGYEGYGIFYPVFSHSPDGGRYDDAIIYAQLFDLYDCEPVDGFKPLELSGFIYGSPTCTWSNQDAIAAFAILNQTGTYRRVDYDPVEFWDNYKMDFRGEPGSTYSWRSDPSITTIQNDVWIVDWAGNYSEGSIRYRILSSSNGYQFSTPYLIDDVYAGTAYQTEFCSGTPLVQIADGYPLVVWERVTVGGYWGIYIKIYYTYKTANGWATPQRLTDTEPDIWEKAPQVAVDLKNKKVHFAWVQRNGPIDYSPRLEFKTINMSNLPNENDTVIVIRPASGEVWSEGCIERIEWLRMTNNYPDHIGLHLYHNGSYRNYLDFLTLPTAYPERDYYDWKVGKFISGLPLGFGAYTNCQIKVDLIYEDDEDPPRSHWATDFSNSFKITPWVEMDYEDFPQITSYGKDLLEKQKSQETGYILSAESDDRNPQDILDGNRLLGYIYPSDTFDLPVGICSYSSPDTVIIQFSRDGGETFTYAVGGVFSDSSIVDTSYSDTNYTDTFFLWKYTDTLTWVSPTAPTNAGCFRVMAVDTASDTAYSEEYGPFYVIAPGGCVLSTHSNQNIMSLNDDADKIGLAYTSIISGSTNYNVVYMESDDGLDFSSPDTVGLGNSAGFSGGACAWKRAKATTAASKDSLYYAYQTGGSFSTPYLLTYTPATADSGRFAPVGILSENDTVHLITKATQAYKVYGTPYSRTTLIYRQFLETSPGTTISLDTLKDLSTTGTTLYDPAAIAPTLAKKDSTIYGAYTVKDSCFFCTITPSAFTSFKIGTGSYPHIGISEGNITYTYLGQGDTTLVRLWRYIDDTAWVERDTFKLDTVANFLSGDRGILFGVQYTGSGRNADVFGYSPEAKTFLRQGYYTGYYAHPYVDDKADEFSWVVAYADYADDSAYTFLHTIRRPLYVPITAAYMESDTKRSPWTVVRDTCITYDDITVDSARDSLVYRIPCLNDDLDYSLTLQFYHEADSTTQLQITVGTKVDTIEVSTEQVAWFHDSIPSNTDTLNIKIKRLSSSSYTFVPLSRIIVHRRSEEGIYVMSDVEEKTENLKISFCLYQPFPNPFKNQATIKFALPYARNVSLKVYDVTGRVVTTLVDGKLDAGEHSLNWSGTDNLNRQCASGVYFVRFETKEYEASKKMVFIK